MTTLTYDKVKDKNYDSMTHAEARLVIIRHVGLNRSPRSAFGKSDLNSIYRYLTGEFYFPKRDYHTPDSPPTGEIRQNIAWLTGIEYDPGPDNIRPFVLSDVQDLARTIAKSEDKR